MPSYLVRIADSAWNGLRPLREDLQRLIQERLERIAELAHEEPLLNPPWKSVGCEVALLRFAVDRYLVTCDLDDRKRLVTLREVSAR